MFEELGRTINALFIFCAISLVIFVPLGLCKLIEIIIWLCHHVKVTL
jgi:hypothetical protein